MKIAITGHTSGIGLALFYYFTHQGHDVIGFSRRTGYNIDVPSDRARIILAAEECDVFVNNAYSNFNDSQLLMLEEIFTAWIDKDRKIVNISTRYVSNENDAYCRTKLKLDEFCNRNIYKLPRIINVKPGFVDTPRVKHLEGVKMSTDSITLVVDFALKHHVQSITFGY